MSRYTVKPSSKVQFYPLLKKYTPDKKGFFVIVRADTDKTIKIEEDAFRAIKSFEKGHTVVEVSGIIGRSKKDVIALVRNLTEAGFIKSIDENNIKDTYPTIRPFKFFLSQNQLRFLTTKWFWTILLLLIIAGFLISITSPQLAPSYRHYFWSNNLLIVYFSLFLIETLLIFLHEFVHFIVTIAVGGQARVRISSRFMNVVAETESYRLSLIDKPKRYLVYLSGMVLNLSIISIIYILFKQQLFLIDNTIRLVLQTTVLLNIQSVIWQFNLFLQTDIYNFMSDFLDSDNLHNNSMLFIVDKIKDIGINLKIRAKLSEDADNESVLDSSEKKHITYYSILFILGISLIVMQYLAFIIPRDLYFISGSLNTIKQGLMTKNLMETGGALALICLVSWKYIALVVIKFKSRKK